MHASHAGCQRGHQQEIIGGVFETAAEDLQIRYDLHQQVALRGPLGETGTAWIIIGFVASLDDALVKLTAGPVSWCVRGLVGRGVPVHRRPLFTHRRSLGSRYWPAGGGCVGWITDDRITGPARYGQPVTPRRQRPDPAAYPERTTPAMTAMTLDALGVTSTDGVANVLATLLAVSTTPATLLLEELARTQIRIEVLGHADRQLTAAEHYRLDAGPITAGYHRTGLLRTASGMVAAETSLVIVPQLIPSHARAALAGTNTPIGKILAPLGMQRLDRRALCRHGCLDSAGGDVAIESSAVLALDGVKVAIATERITGQFCQLIAAGTR